jgi:putative protease
MELMAPAGGHEALLAGIQAGAGSVYFGVEQLNMRARNNLNFTLEDLPNVADTCHQHGVKAYLTLNTILYDHDMSLMRTIVDAAKSSGINALIASDFAVMSYAQKVGMPIHVSTQANVSNVETVEFFAAFSDVMVLARELSLMQVAEIVRQIRKKAIKGPSGELVRIEIFGHGALCMAISGKCYLSLHSHYASANRGACIQNCRRNYIVTDKQDGIELEIDNEYIMSAKDLCTIGFLDKILEAGVSVLKIEGRSRSSDYVYTTTKCYKEALDAIAVGTYTREKVKDWETRLATVYNRGFWDGYYLGKKMGEWNDEYGSKATKRKVYIGRGIKYFGKVQVGEFKIEKEELAVGDEIFISGPTTGVIQTTVKELRVNDENKTRCIKGDVISLPLDTKIRRADKLYKIVDA